MYVCIYIYIYIYILYIYIYIYIEISKYFSHSNIYPIIFLHVLPCKNEQTYIV